MHLNVAITNAPIPTQTTNPKNHQESINIRIRGEL